LAGYTSTVAQISGDDRLTPEAKAVDLAKAHTKAQTDLSGVRATVEQQEAETVERLASSVFGNPASTGCIHPIAPLYSTVVSGPLIGPVDPWRFPAGSLINGGNLLVGLARFELATP
jgi:hypothetical protein